MPTVELAQGRIHYSDDGRGPTVVLVHGAFVSARLWRKVIPILSRTNRVIAPHLPLGAHPEPMRPEADISPLGVARLLADLLERLDLDDVTLVGNDTGGALAQMVAAHHPERVGRLVLTNCDMLDVFPPKVLKPTVAALKLPGSLEVLRRLLGVRAIYKSPLAFGWLAKHGFSDDVIDLDLAALRDKGVQNDLRRFLRAASDEQTERAAQVLERSGLPILLAWGDDDRFFPLSLARRFLARVPSARLEVIADSYAFTPEDQPEALAAHITAFAAARAPLGVAAAG
jgi:pimeloyl-ACP methyl ester carboxylesterase